VIDTLWQLLLGSLLAGLIVLVWIVIGAVVWGMVQYARGKRPGTGQANKDRGPGSLEIRPGTTTWSSVGQAKTITKGDTHEHA